jgi:hypothetical protein
MSDRDGDRKWGIRALIGCVRGEQAKLTDYFVASFHGLNIHSMKSS